MITDPTSPRRSGFTLLEVVLAVAILAIIMGLVLGITRSSLALSNTITETQNEEMGHQAFFDFLGDSLSALPGNTRFELVAEDSASHYLSDLTLQNVPLSFTWGGEERIAKAVRLSTVKRRSGFLSIILSYYENEILENSTNGGKPVSEDEKPFAEIALLDDVAYFEWRVLDGRTMEWQYDWDIQGRLPLQLELTMAIGAKGDEIRHVFWLPPKQNPEVVMRQMNQGNPGGTPGGPGNPGTPGGGNITVPGGGNITVPGGGAGKR
jgi:prepilin-type N-terminal cleavage/methylation domain-containing protein